VVVFVADTIWVTDKIKADLKSWLKQGKSTLKG
jgi:hypothetical protein